MKMTLGFSPCPNDTWIFEAMVHKRIDTEGVEYEWFLADVEELNRRALDGSVDVTKMSYHAYAYTAGNYLLLDSGGALGRNNGPLVVSRRKIYPEELNETTIAIPGRYTTANMLFSIFWPEAKNKKEYLFSDIPDVVLSGEADAGLIIHETRFTYKKMGLQKIADTGEMWEGSTGMPVPLGGIVVNRNIDEETALKVDRTIKRSVEYANAHPEASYDFIRKHAKEIDAAVMRQHIELYVNRFTVSLGDEGRKAVNKMYEVASEKKIIPVMPERIFLIR